MDASKIISKALIYQKENYSFVKTAFTYTGCPGNEVNIIWHWFNRINNSDMDDFKSEFGFPRTEADFRSSWWRNFIQNEVYNTPYMNYFRTLAENQLCEAADSNSFVLHLGENPLCKQTPLHPFISASSWRNVDSVMSKIVFGFFVLKKRRKMIGDNTSSSVYSRLFNITVQDSQSQEVDMSSRGNLTGLYEEIPPAIFEEFESEKPDTISDSYEYIKKQVDRFIKKTYLSRAAIIPRYDWAMNILLSTFKNPRYVYESFWSMIPEKYRREQELFDILNTDIEIVCPPDATTPNCYAKFYDLGFIQYTSEVVNKDELINAINKYINFIRYLQIPILLKDAEKARLTANFFGALDSPVNKGLKLTTELLKDKGNRY